MEDEALQQIKKFRLDYRKAVDVWGRDCSLPVYDGLMLLTKTEDEEIVLANIYWDAKVQECFLELAPGVSLDEYIKNYAEFKDFCSIVKLAKYHIGLAHQVILSKK